MFTPDTVRKLRQAEARVKEIAGSMEVRLQDFLEESLNTQYKEALRKSLNTDVPAIAKILAEAKKESELLRLNIKFPNWDVNIEEIVSTMTISLMEYTLLEYGDPYYGVPPFQTFSKLEAEIIASNSQR